jgi:hypothetical protein
MSDLFFVIVAVTFFAICVAYIKGCDRLMEKRDE